MPSSCGESSLLSQSGMHLVRYPPTSVLTELQALPGLLLSPYRQAHDCWTLEPFASSPSIILENKGRCSHTMITSDAPILGIRQAQEEK